MVRQRAALMAVHKVVEWEFLMVAVKVALLGFDLVDYSVVCWDARMVARWDRSTAGKMD